MIKKIASSGIMVLVCATLFAQRSLEKIWVSDSTVLKGPESVLFDATANTLYVSSMASGSVVVMDSGGKVLNHNWVYGLNANKGSALFNGLFYTAETSAIAVVDVSSAKIIKRIPVEGAIMLNDLAVDAKGIIYVSDTRAGKVYRVEGDKPVLYLENLPGANGLLAVQTDLYVLTSASVAKVNAQKTITIIGEGFESGLDGIVQVAADEFIISNYKGMLYHLNADGSKHLLLDSRAQGIMANDISYNNKTKTLYVPSFGTNRIIAYKLK